MNVLLLNSLDSRGGAARACQRLADALRRQGLNVNMLSSEGHAVAPQLSHIKVPRYRRFINSRFDKYLLKIKRLFPRDDFSTGFVGYNLSTHPLVKEADIIHLHWINRGFISSEGIQQLSRIGKPIVWTMHDMWPFTGGCHYSMGCTRFIADCGKCPVLNSSTEPDLSTKVLKRKKQQFDTRRISFITPSNWLKNEALKSSLLEKAVVECIPNPLDTDLFQPINKQEAREKLGYSKDKKLILFGAANPLDTRKGLVYLTDALKIVEQQYADLAGSIELVIFGSISSVSLEGLSFPVHYTGNITNDRQLAMIYAAADCFAIPSLQDNLPNTIAESMSCGTPCLGFNIGGIPDLVVHGENGYLVDTISAGAYAKGIYELLSDAHKLETFSHNSRVYAQQKLNYHDTALQVIHHYRSSLENAAVR
jgi:glycosyltransferase involved in cell wall biosynthesis